MVHKPLTEDLMEIMPQLEIVNSTPEQTIIK